MGSDRDYYRILLVSPDAPAAIIHTSYRTLLQRLSAQPAAGADPAQAALLAEAYDVLSDPERRAAYDLARDIAASPDDYSATTVLDPDAARYAAHALPLLRQPARHRRRPRPRGRPAAPAEARCSPRSVIASNTRASEC